MLLPNRTTKTFTIDENLKKYAIFTLYYKPNFEEIIHDEKDVFYKFNNVNDCIKIHGYNKRIIEKIKIDSNKIIFNYNPDIMTDRGDARIVFIHAQWWD
jgi:hypothetical protein